MSALLRHSQKYQYSIIYSNKDAVEWLEKYSEDKQLVFIQPRSLLHRINTFLNALLNTKILQMTSKLEMEKIKGEHFDLLIVPFHNPFGFMFNIPYIVTVTNLMYKYYSHNKELAVKHQFRADIGNQNITRHSILTVVDSREGLNDLRKFFNVEESKIRIVPHIPPEYIFTHSTMDMNSAGEILAPYHLPPKFLFYPSQFWFHKNHERLIRSLHRIRKTHDISLPIVLTGHPYESYNRIMQVVKDLGMQDQVFHLGYVSDLMIVALYKKATALIYPSLYGPTNIPPLEAMILGTPVVCSNLFSMPEQVGDAGLLFDPFSIEDMANNIFTIWVDDHLRKKLIQKGYEKIKYVTQKQYAKQWEEVITDALTIVQSHRS
jgi:glycosyltransferase involved in cell wall biosynthesis